MQGLSRISVPNGTVGGGTTYTAAQVQGFLQSASALEDWTFDQVAADGVQVKGDLSPFIDYAAVPEVVHDSTAKIKRTLHFRIRGDAPLVPLTDLVRPRYRLAAPDGGWLEWSLGTFVTGAPRRSVADDGDWLDYTCSDMTQAIADATLQAPVSFSAGSNPLVGVAQLVSGYGGSAALTVQIPDSGKTLANAIAYVTGDSRLKAINGLMAAVNFTDVWADDLVIRSAVIPDYSKATPAFTFDATANPSIQGFTEHPDLARAFNVCVVVVEAAGKTPFRGRYVNSSPDSPVSTVRWARQKVVVIRDSKIVDQATADARAASEIRAAARIYSELVVPTGAWAFSQDRDVYGLVYSNPDDGVVQTKTLELGWTHRFGAGITTMHRLTRVPSV